MKGFQKLENNKYWGYHLRVNAIGDKTKVKDRDTIFNFAKELVVAIDMKPYGEPEVIFFGEEERVAGHSLNQFVYTSNITGHFVDVSGEIFLCVFSCKPYDENIVVDVMRKYFDIGDDHNLDFTAREAGRLVSEG